MAVDARPMWRRRRIEKLGRGSQTPGKLKGETSQTDPDKKFFLTSPRAVKLHDMYAHWHNKAKTWNGYGKDK